MASAVEALDAHVWTRGVFDYLTVPELRAVRDTCGRLRGLVRQSGAEASGWAAKFGASAPPDVAWARRALRLSPMDEWDLCQRSRRSLRGAARGRGAGPAAPKAKDLLTLEVKPGHRLLSHALLSPQGRVLWWDTAGHTVAIPSTMYGEAPARGPLGGARGDGDAPQDPRRERGGPGERLAAEEDPLAGAAHRGAAGHGRAARQPHLPQEHTERPDAAGLRKAGRLDRRRPADHRRHPAGTSGTQGPPEHSLEAIHEPSASASHPASGTFFAADSKRQLWAIKHAFFGGYPPASPDGGEDDDEDGGHPGPGGVSLLKDAGPPPGVVVRRYAAGVRGSHSRKVAALAASDRLVFSGGWDGAVKAWSRGRARLEATVYSDPGVNASVDLLLAVEDGGRLLSHGCQHAVGPSLLLHDVEKQAVATRFTPSATWCDVLRTGFVSSFKKLFDTSSPHVVVGGSSSHVVVFDTRTPREVGAIAYPTRQLTSLASSPSPTESTLFFSGHAAGSVACMSLRTMSTLWTQSDDSSAVTALVPVLDTDDDGTGVLSARYLFSARDATVRLQSLRHEHPATANDIGAVVHCLPSSPVTGLQWNGFHLLVARRDALQLLDFTRTRRSDSCRVLRS